MAVVLASFLIGMSVNSDHVVFATHVGKTTSTAPLAWRMVIPLISVVACLFGSLSGLKAGRLLTQGSDGVLGSAVLVCLGIWTIAESLHTVFISGDSPFEAGFSETMFIALSRALANLCIGFGVGFMKLSVTATVASVFVCSVMTVLIPVSLRRHFVPIKWSRPLGLFSGVLLVAFGLFL